MMFPKCLWTIATTVVAVQTVMGLPDAAKTSHSPKIDAFTYNRTHFLLHGEPFTIIGGQMDPQRIPYQFWRDRLVKAKAMGLNTIFTYPFWNELEPEEGHWRSHQPQNDVAEFFRTAQEEGLYVVLRPGPYICGERDWGGFPAWLTQIPGLVVRSNNEPFLAQTARYMRNLARKSGLADLQISRGGPILMVQVENEYGSYGEDHKYTAAVRDIVRENFEVVLYTNDGGGADWTLKGGQIPGVLAAVDGGAYALPSRDEFITDESSLGPLLNGGSLNAPYPSLDNTLNLFLEYYTWTFDIWGSHNPHNTIETNEAAVQQILEDIPYHLSNWSASISFYMVHGGTNFGFSNGALWQNRTTAFISSYDYGSPIDETGRTTDLYHKMREAILPFVSDKKEVPEPPKNLPRASIPEFSLERVGSLFEHRGKKTSAPSPLTMEQLGQSYGYTLYEHTATSRVKGDLHPGDGPRDRVIVYVNEKAQGVMDSQYQHPLNVSVSLEPGDKLQLLVENLGRVDYYSRGNPYDNKVIDPLKGVKGDISVGGKVLKKWDMYSMQLDHLPQWKSYQERPSKKSDAPRFYKGSFKGPQETHHSVMTLDTFITVPNGIKGNVWVNGFNLGRYWFVGPQQSLYLPGSVVKSGKRNEVVVLELEPWQLKDGNMVACGNAERVWGNNPDIDCLECV